MSNDHRDELGRLIHLLPSLESWADLSVGARKRLAVHPNWDQSLLLYEALGGAAQTIRHDTERLAHDGIGLAPAPLLAGDDLIAADREPGPSFKTLLDQAYDLQLQGELQTREQALAWLDSQPR